MPRTVVVGGKLQRHPSRVYTGNFDRRKGRLLRAHAAVQQELRFHFADGPDVIRPLIERSNAINAVYRRLCLGLITERSQP